MGTERRPDEVRCFSRRGPVKCQITLSCLVTAESWRCHFSGWRAFTPLGHWVVYYAHHVATKAGSGKFMTRGGGSKAVQFWEVPWMSRVCQALSTFLLSLIQSVWLFNWYDTPPSPTPTLTLIPFLSYPFMSVYLSLFSKYLLPIALLLLPYSIALSLSLCAPPPLLWPRMAQRHSHAHRRGGKCSGRRTCVA